MYLSLINVGQSCWKRNLRHALLVKKNTWHIKKETFICAYFDLLMT